MTTNEHLTDSAATTATVMATTYAQPSTDGELGVDLTWTDEDDQPTGWQWLPAGTADEYPDTDPDHRDAWSWTDADEALAAEGWRRTGPWQDADTAVGPGATAMVERRP